MATVPGNTQMTDAAADRHDPASPMARLFGSRWAQLGWFLLVALVTRVSVFGDTDYHNDELLFFLIGQRMHDGLLPYVDLWDRKGPALFLVYYLIAGVSRSVLAYQIAACLFAALTALVANMIAERFAGRLGSMLAGTLYLIMLPLFAGGGGQAPVFYNLFMAVAVLLLLRSAPALRLGRVSAPAYGAMASAGLAIACKQTALFEGAFLGCFALWQLQRGGVAPARQAARALGLAFAGAAPMLAFAGLYAAIGHFSEFWHAMVTSNLAKTYNPGSDAGARATALAIVASPVLLPSAARFLLGRDEAEQPGSRAFLAGWLIAALAGFLAIPNFIDHYTLPLLLPLAVSAAPALEWRLIGPVYGVVAAIMALTLGPSLDFSRRQASREAMAQVVSEIRSRDPKPRLFVFQGPTYLYALLDSYPPSPLIFPVHLFHRPESNTSHLDTSKEVAKILAWKPTVVVRYKDFPPGQLNPDTARQVEAYLKRCAFWSTRTVIDYYGPQEIQIYGDCRDR